MFWFFGGNLQITGQYNPLNNPTNQVFFHCSLGYVLAPSPTLPKTKIFAFENGWLEDDRPSFWGPAFFQGRKCQFFFGYYKNN